MFTIIHPKNVHKNSLKEKNSRGQKVSLRIHHKCPREFTLKKCPLEFACFEKKCPREVTVHEKSPSLWINWVGITLGWNMNVLFYEELEVNSYKMNPTLEHLTNSYFTSTAFHKILARGSCESHFPIFPFQHFRLSFKSNYFQNGYYF